MKHNGDQWYNAQQAADTAERITEQPVNAHVLQMMHKLTGVDYPVSGDALAKGKKNK